MANVIAGYELIDKIAEIFGVDKNNLRGFTLRVFSDEVVTVSIEKFGTSEIEELVIPLIEQQNNAQRVTLEIKGLQNVRIDQETVRQMVAAALQKAMKGLL